MARLSRLCRVVPSRASRIRYSAASVAFFIGLQMLVGAPGFAAPPSATPSDLFAEMCNKVPLANSWRHIFPTDDDLGLTPLLILYRPSTKAEIDCALGLSYFLNARALDKETAADGSTDDGTTDFVHSDRLIWDLVEQATYNPDLSADLKGYIGAALLSWRTQSHSDRFAQVLRLASLSLPKPSEDIQSLKLSDFERITVATTGYRLGDFLTVGIRQLKRTNEAGAGSPDASVSPMEYEALKRFAVDIFEESLSGAGTQTFYDQPVANWTDVGDATLMRLDILQSLIASDPDVVKRVILDWMASSKPMVFKQQVSAARVPQPATFNVSATTYTGRCGNGTTPYSASNLQAITTPIVEGLICTYNGNHTGYAEVDFLNLSAVPVYGSIGLDIHEEIFSKLFGAHRDGVTFGASDEDETSRIQYTADGTETTPSCSDIGFCNTLIDVSLADNSRVGDPASDRPGDEPSASSNASYTVGNGQSTAVPLDQHVLVDRSSGDVTFHLSEARTDTHIGVGAPPAPLRQMFDLVLVVAPPPPTAADNSQVASLAHSYLTKSDGRYFLANSAGRYTLGQIVAYARRFSPTDVALRFSDVYYRLYIESILEQSTSSNIDGFDSQSLALAKASLSQQAETAYYDSAKTAYATTQQLFASMSFDELSTNLTGVINKLIATGDCSGDPLDYLNSLGTKVANSSIVDPGLSNEVQSAKTAATPCNQNDLIERLLELRARLWLSQAEIYASQIDLGNELSLYPRR